MRILFATPGYWPSTAYGGPITKMRELAHGLAARGHEVEVVTTSLVDLSARPPWRGRTELVDGVPVHYLGTPFRYRWMGVTPGIGRCLATLERPDVLHVFGFRDVVGTVAARWARRRGVPYVFEGLGMVRPRLHKVALKRALDSTLYRPVLDGAAVHVATSVLETADLVAAGVPAAKVTVRPNGFPPPLEAPFDRPGPLRQRLGLAAGVPLVLALGRVADGKGLELLVAAVPELGDAHLAIVGPDDRRGLREELEGQARRAGCGDRVHLTGPLVAAESLGLCGDADVCALASAGESFGMVAAEAASAGTASLVTDRCGIAELLRDRAGLVVPYDGAAIAAGLGRLLGDRELRNRLGAEGRRVAAEWSWPAVVELQEAIYERAVRGG